MKPIPPTDLIAVDPLDALIDLCDAAPADGDDRVAAWLETCVYAEQVKANDAGDAVAFERAKGRGIAAAHYRTRICAALNLTTTGQTTRKAAA